MTILFVTHYAGFYGANKLLLTLMSLLREKHGVQPLALLPYDRPLGTQLKKKNITLQSEPLLFVYNGVSWP